MSFLLDKVRLIFSLNINTIRFNFHYFPITQAIKFPVSISSNVILSKLGGRVILEEPMYFAKIKFGYGKVGIFDQKLSRSIWQVKGIVEFKGNALIGHGSKISVDEGGVLLIGKNFTVSAQASIVAFKNITIGNDCLISWDVLIMDTDFHKIKDLNNLILNAPASIKLGNKIWVGARCLILKGAEIPSNSVVAAGTIVTKKLTGENQVFAGAPAKVVKKGITWEQ